MGFIVSAVPWSPNGHKWEAHISLYSNDPDNPVLFAERKIFVEIDGGAESIDQHLRDFFVSMAENLGGESRSGIL